MRSILIIDDHPLMQAALKQLLEYSNGEIQVITAATAEAGLEIVKNNQPQELALIILDFGLPLLTGYSAILAFRRAAQDIPLLVITGSEDTQITRQIQHYGVAGFLSKASKPEIICQTVQQLITGQQAFNAEIPLPQDETSQLRDTFTRMEVRVLILVNKGYSNKQIAEHFQIKEISVKKHIANIFIKLKVNNRVGVIKEIQRLGFFIQEHDYDSI